MLREVGSAEVKEQKSILDSTRKHKIRLLYLRQELRRFMVYHS